MKLLSGILSKNTSLNNKSNNSSTSVANNLNSCTQSSSSSGSNYSSVSGSISSSNTSSSCSVISSVASLSSSSISKTRKEQQQLNCSSSAEYCNTSASIQSPPLSARKGSNKANQQNNITSTTLSPTPSQSCSFSSPKKQSNNTKETKDNHQQATVNQSSLNSPERNNSHHQRQASEDFLNSLSFALPQIEYEEAMKQVQQRTGIMSNQNDNITAENIEVMSSDGYDFEYYNKEEEERKLKKKQSASSSSKKKNETKQQPSSTPSTPASNSFKSPIKSSAQPVISQTPTKSSSSSVKSKSITPAVNQSTEALTTLSTSKSRLSLKPTTIKNKIKKKDSPKQQQHQQKNSQNKSKPIISSEPPKVNSSNRKERKNSEKSTTSSKSGNSSIIVNSAPKNEDQVIAVIVDEEDEEMNDVEHDLSSAHELHTTEMLDDEEEAEEEDDDEEESCNTITSPHTPCSKKRKAFEEFEDSPASSKKKKEDSIILDSVIKKVMEISIPDTPAMEEDSPSCDSSLSISPSLSYNSQSTCGEHSEYCISPLDSITYDAKLYSAQSSVDIKEVNQKITTLTKVIEQRNSQILQRDEYISNLSKENKELKKFKSMIHKLDDVGFVFYMKASELVCEGLMARDLNTKESQEIIHDSLQKGIRYMRASAEFGNVDAMFEYAELILRYSKSKKHEAKEFLQKASEKGHKKAGVFLKSLELKEETQRYEKSVEHDHLFLYGQEITKTKSKRK